MGDGLQSSTLNYDQLYEQARGSGYLMDGFGNGVINDLRASNPDAFSNIEFEQGPLKTRERSDAKIEGDYNGDHRQISDLRRGRIIVDTPEQAQLVREHINQNTDQLGIEKMKDRFAKPSDTHFRDINAKVRLENGHVAEFRVEHRGLLEAAKNTHEPYERVQDIERTASKENRPLNSVERIQRQEILDEIRDIHDAPANRDGLNQLLNDEGRQKLINHEAERVTPVKQTGFNQVDIKDIGTPVPDNAGGVGGWSKVVGRLGAVGGVITGGALLLQGEFAQAAESALPLGASAVAVAENRPVEAIMTGIEETGIGLIATEIARPIAQSLGADVEDGLIQSGLDNLVKEVERSPEQIQFDNIYDNLPLEISDNMSPEMQSLVEMKRMIVESEQQLDGFKNKIGGIGSNLGVDRLNAETQLDKFQEMYSEQYDQLEVSGKIASVSNEADSLKTQDLETKDSSVNNDAVITQKLDNTSHFTNG